MLVVLTASAASAQTVWSNRDIGRPAAGSTEVVDETTLRIVAAGDGIGSTSDQFHFTYRYLYGDADIVARIDSVTKSGAAAQIGLMFRAALGAKAKNVALLYSPLTGVVLQTRAVGSGRTQRTFVGAAHFPLWLRLVRHGDIFTAYRSADGTTWNQVGRTTVKMKVDVYAGMAATSGRERLVSTYNLSSVGLSVAPPSLPIPWTRTDVGDSDRQGFSWTDTATFIADSTGVGIGEGAEGFHYVYQPFTGDMTVEARSAALLSPSTQALAGLMIRKDLSASSAYVMVARSRNKVWETRIRGGAIAASVQATGPDGHPGWFRLVRTGNLVQAFESPDRVNWQEVAAQDVDLDETAYVGMAVSSGEPSVVARGIFGGVWLHPGPPPVNAPPTVEIVTPWAKATYNLGAPVSVRAAASDSDGRVRRVDFYADGVLVESVDKAPFVATYWGPATQGTVTLTAVATDGDGATAASEPVEIGFDELDAVGDVAVAFTPSVDHDWVHHYEVSFYVAGSDTESAVPVSTTEIGKPPVSESGEIVVDIHDLVTALPAGSFYAVVSAVVSSYEGRSTASAEFSR